MMKRLVTIMIVVCFCFITGRLFAQSESSISDLMYMPEEGALAFELGYGFSKDHAKSTMDYFGIKSESDSKENEYDISLFYGVSSNMTILFSEGYSRAKTETKNDGWFDSGPLIYKGMKDPDFGIRYRLDMPLFVDIEARYSPKLFKNKESTDTSDGTMGKGNHSFQLMLETGKKSDMVSYAFGFIGCYNTESTQETDDGKEKTTGGHEIGCTARGQYMINDSVPLNFGTIFCYVTKSTSKDSESTSKIDPMKSIAFIFGTGFVFSPDLMLSLDCYYSKIMDFDIKEDSGSTTSVSDMHGMGIDLALKCQI